MPVIDAVSVASFFKNNGGELSKAIQTTGKQPLDFFLDTKRNIRRIETNDFTSSDSELKFMEEQKYFLTSLLKSMKFYLPHWKRPRCESIIMAAEQKSNIILILSSLESGISEIYSGKSEYWEIALDRIKTENGNIMRNAFLDFRHNFSRKPPESEEVYDYIKSLICLDENGIESFEMNYSPAKEREVKKHFAFMHMFDIESVWHGEEIMCNEIYEVDLSYPKRWAICGGSGAGKTKCAELLEEFYSKTHKIICLNDRNAEANYTRYPSPDINQLAKYGKKPKGFDIEIFSLPPFKQEADQREIKRINKIIRINPYILKRSDWSALLDLNMVQEIAFSNLLKTLDQASTSVVDISKKLNVSQSIHPSIKKAISSKLDNLINQDVFSDRNSNDIHDILMSPKISVFDTSLIYDQALLRGTISLFLRQISDYAKRYKSPKPFAVFIEELQSLIQESISNTQFEVYLQELIRRLRASNCSAVLIQQNVKDVPAWARSNISTWVILRIRDASQLNLLKESFGYDMAYVMDIVPKLPHEHAIMIDDIGVKGGRILPATCRHKMPLEASKSFQ